VTALSSYSTGTASVAADGTTVTGTTVLWLTTGNAKPGDLFQSGHFCALITDVTDETHLTIMPWPGSTLSGAPYAIWKVSQQRIVGATSAMMVDKLVTSLNTSGFFVFVDISATTPDPSLGDDGQYAFQPTTGKTWVKSAGVWSYLGIYKAFQLRGAWSGATAYTVNDVVTLSGSSYACVLSHTNQTPPNTTYWQLLASKGDPGGTGPQGAGYGGTSTTSLAIGTGSKAFTTQAGLAYTNGARMRASSAANTSNWMEGLATYSGTTLTITVDKTNGSGTLASWNLNVVGQPGAGDLSSANNLSDVANVTTARTNLGINQAVALGASQDFNAVVAPGSYYPVDSASTNAPVAGDFWYLTVEFFGGGTYTKQTATRVNSPGETYVRIRISGAWQPWRRVLTGDNNLSDVANADTALGNLAGVSYHAQSPNSTEKAQARSNIGVATDDSAAKAWALFHWSGSAVVIDASYNVASVTRTAAGIYVVNFTTAFASANYCCQVATEIAGNTTEGCTTLITTGTRATGSVQIRFLNQAMSAAVDPTAAHFVAYGR
jgi:hypothetical protein